MKIAVTENKNASTKLIARKKNEDGTYYIVYK